CSHLRQEHSMATNARGRRGGARPTQAVEKGPDARRRAPRHPEAYSLYVERVPQARQRSRWTLIGGPLDDRGHAAVEVDRGAADEGGALGDQEGDEVAELLGFAD